MITVAGLCEGGNATLVLRNNDVAQPARIARIVAEKADGRGGAGVVVINHPTDVRVEERFDLSSAIRILGARPGMPFAVRVRIEVAGAEDFIDPIFIAQINDMGEVVAFSSRTAYAVA